MSSSTVEDGLVIDMEAMKDISIDKDNKCVAIGGGCNWGEVYTALDEVDLMCAGGGVHVVGVGGHLTGGGYGPYSWNLAMACDLVLQATVVIADGSIVTASETENPDLFFGIRGGSSSFGVVTQFVLQTLPRQGPYSLRTLGFPVSVVKEVDEALQKFMKQDYAQRGLLPFLYMVRGPPPHHPPLLIVNFNGVGQASNIPEAFEPFLAMKPIFDQEKKFKTMPEFSHVLDDLLLLGAPRKTTASAPITELWPGMVEEILKEYLDYTNSTPDATAHTKVFFEFLHAKRLKPEGSCVPYIEPIHHMLIASDEHTDVKTDAAADAFVTRVSSIGRKYQKKHGGRNLGANGNATTLVQKGDQIWLQNYPKLRKVKAKYDPNLVFNRYHTIEPDFS
ncbi:hypothetical protein ONS96_003207 [Cadophora gregata f. sp. sojae]|nr:hypothetical protein ONS96_003207 [Cadophora gregata f. sp. sojae]